MTLAAVLTGVLPSIGVLAIFIYAMRAILRGDRRERQAMAEFDRQEAQAASRAAAATSTPDDSEKRES